MSAAVQSAHVAQGCGRAGAGVGQKKSPPRQGLVVEPHKVRAGCTLLDFPNCREPTPLDGQQSHRDLGVVSGVREGKPAKGGGSAIEADGKEPECRRGK